MKNEKEVRSFRNDLRKMVLGKCPEHDNHNFFEHMLCEDAREGFRTRLTILDWVLDDKPMPEMDKAIESIAKTAAGMP